MLQVSSKLKISALDRSLVRVVYESSVVDSVDYSIIPRKVMLAVLLGLCRKTFCNKPSFLTHETVKVEFRDYFLDVLVKCTR